MEQLGINPLNLLAQIVNFGILFYVLNKFVFKSIISLVNQQKKKEQETEKKTLEIEQQWQKIEKLKQKELEKAKDKARIIIDEAKKEAENEKNKIISNAILEAKAISLEAQLELNRKEELMKQELKDHTANLAVKIAAKLISKFLGQGQQKTLLNQSILELKKIKS